jgi:hypothetical protein
MMSLGRVRRSRKQNRKQHKLLKKRKKMMIKIEMYINVE